MASKDRSVARVGNSGGTRAVFAAAGVSAAFGVLAITGGVVLAMILLGKSACTTTDIARSHIRGTLIPACNAYKLRNSSGEYPTSLDELVEPVEEQPQRPLCCREPDHVLGQMSAHKFWVGWHGRGVAVRVRDLGAEIGEEGCQIGGACCGSYEPRAQHRIPCR